MCHVTQDHVGVQGGTVPSMSFLHFSFREADVCKSASLVTVQLQASSMNLCLVRQLPAALSALFSHTRPHGGLGPFFFSLLLFKCLAQNFLCDLISGPSYDVPLLPVLCIFFTLFWLPSLVRARVPRTSEVNSHLPWLCLEPLYSLRVMYTFCLRKQPFPFKKGIAINLPLLCEVS